MTEFVGKDACDLVGILRLRQQSVEQIDLAAGQREGVGNRRRQHAGLHRRIEPGGFTKRCDQLGKGLLSDRIVANLAAEQRLDLPIRDVAEPPFEHIRHQRRQAIGGERDPEQYDGNDRGGGRERPADNGRNAAAGNILVHSVAAGD